MIWGYVMGKFCLFNNRMHYLYNPKDSNIFINMLFSCKFSKLIGVCVVFYLYVVPVIFFVPVWRMTVSLNSWQSVMLKPGIFPFLCRTHGLVSSAEALGVITDADGDESRRKAEPSPVQDRAARYRLARLRCKTKLLESFNPWSNQTFIWLYPAIKISRDFGRQQVLKTLLSMQTMTKWIKANFHWKIFGL